MRLLLGRVVAGAVAEHYGWRAMYWLGLLLVTATGCLLAAVLPRSQVKTQAGYGELLKSLMTLCARSRPCGGTMIQGCLFSSFIAFWTILALQLDARYQRGAETAGLFGLVGVVGFSSRPSLEGSPTARGRSHKSLEMAACPKMARRRHCRAVRRRSFN
jgi:predicted MFS family arabinose efflux permease